MDVATFILHVFTLCIGHGGSVTSWIRSTRHNMAVGGQPNSLHRVGLAADLVFDEPADQLSAAITAKRLGLYALDEGSHLHVQAYAPLMTRNT
jgi:hypothetical protein